MRCPYCGKRILHSNPDKMAQFNDKDKMWYCCSYCLDEMLKENAKINGLRHREDRARREQTDIIRWTFGQEGGEDG